MDTVAIVLTEHEADQLLHLLGTLPIRSDAYPLYLKIKEQLDRQTPE